MAVTFAKSLQDLRDLMALPMVFLGFGIQQANAVTFYVLALLRKGHTSSLDLSPEAMEEIDEEVRRLHEEAAADRQSSFNIVKQTSEQIAHYIEHHQQGRPMRGLLYATVSIFWTAFECCAKDAWIAALNANPASLGLDAFAKQRPGGQVEEGVTARQVSVGLLARYGFDIKDKLGTILAPKYDFTSISGIRRAYSVLADSSEVVDALSDENLGSLEVTRHLIVHRAGLVDEEYKRRIKDPVKIGTRLQLSGARVAGYGNAVVTSGCALLRAVDTLILAGDREQSPDAGAS